MLEVIKLFVRRMLMGKGKGILKIPPQNKVDDFANDLYKKFKQNGVSDEAVTNPNDVKAIWNQITNKEAQIFTNNLKDVLQKPDPFKKAGEVFDLKGNKIKNPQNIMGGEEIIETEAQILKRLNKENKESLSNMRYEAASKAEEAKAAADEDYIIKLFDPEDFAQGGRAGLYRGGQAEIQPNLSDIGHGSDALMARNTLLTPGSQATTSTGLNYLLGEDNDTTRVPYKHGDMVLPKEKPMDEYMLKQVLSQAGAKTLDTRTRDMFIQMYKKKIKEKNSKADGGRTEFKFGGNPHESDSKVGSGQTSGKSSAPPGEKGGQGYVTPKTKPIAPPGEKGGQGYVAPTPKTGPVTTGGESPFGYTKPYNLPSFVNKYNKNNLKKSNFLKNFLKHRTNSQIMKGKFTDVEGYKPSYVPDYTHALGGYDFKQNFPNMPEAIAKGLAYGYQHVTETPRGIMNIDPKSSIFSDTGLIGSLKNSFNKANIEAAKNVEGFTGEGISQSDMDKYNDWQALNMAQGGPARQKFGLGRRAFLKWMASGVAGIGAAKSGLFSLLKGGAGKKVATEVVKDVAGSGTPPPYFFKLVNKIKKLGDDVTETGALAERQKVKQYKDFTLTEDVSTGRVEVVKNKPNAEGYDNFGNGLTEEVYMGYTPSETIVVKGKPVKKGPQYDEGTAYIRNDGPNTGDIYDETVGVTDDILEEVGEAIVKKADGGRIGYNLGSKVIGKGIAAVTKKAGEGKFTKNEVLLNMFKNTIKQSKSADTKKRFTNFIEEIKLKPELSKDPNVWNFFTKGLPKNQKLIVYGDDTVDFWTQSEFGPHNIATSAKFQKKHPYLTKDQAVKIQNMEPEDQIFEMKRLETIRKRTNNSSGGIAAMLGE